MGRRHSELRASLLAVGALLALGALDRHLPPGLLLFAGMAAAFGLGYANGANDVSKAVATLVGAGVTNYKRALYWGAGWTTAGALLAGTLATAMLATFTTGLLGKTAQLTDSAALAMVLGALAWLCLATRVKMPVSTTHAITGSVVFVGAFALGSGQVVWAGLLGKIVLPLLISPLVAFGLAIVVRVFVRPTLALAPLGVLHWLSAGAASLARGLNDTPRIVALGVTFLTIHQSLGGASQMIVFWAVAVSMGAGSLLGGRGVTVTLAERVTRLDHVEGLAANLTTAVLVATSANLGLPVSTTHVSSSAIIGIGLRKGLRTVDWEVVRDMALAWLITLPTAGLLGVMAYGVLLLAGASPWFAVPGLAAIAVALGSLGRSRRRQKTRVLFVCTHNSARSQMAEGLLRSLAGDRYEVFSAGTHATGVRPEAVAVMAEGGIDISQQTSKALEPFVDRTLDYVITVCDRANENCPTFPRASHRLHWPFPDPSEAQGDEAERLAVFRDVRQDIESRLRAFAA